MKRWIVQAFAISYALTAVACAGDDSSTTTTENPPSTTETPTTSDPSTTSVGPTSTTDNTTLPPTTETTDTGTTGTEDGTVEKAVEAIGGEAALEGLVTLETISGGAMYIHDEGAALGDPALPFGSYTSDTKYDLSADNIRVDFERDNQFVMAAFTYSEIIQGELGAIDGVDGLFGPSLDMQSARVGSTRKTVRLLNPHLLLKDILADPMLAEDGGEDMYDDELHEIIEFTDSIAPLQIWVNSETGNISRLVTMENDHLHRDSELEVIYGGWTVGDGDLLYPETVAIFLGGESVIEEMRTEFLENPAFDATAFDFPDGAMPMAVPVDETWGAESSQFHQMFSALGIPLDFRQTFVVPTELDPGIFHLTGGSHHSMAVEQDTSVVIIEAPLYPERSEAIIAWAETQFPGKPITHVIATHHHADHSAGLRAFVAAGATIVMHEASAMAFEDVFAAPSIIQPDAQSMAPMIATFSTVLNNDSVTLDDPNNAVEAFHIATGHAGDLLIIQVTSPNTTFVFESDLYNPGNGGAALNPGWAQELLDGINTNGLNVDMLVGGHGGIAPLMELEAYLMP